jgi:hypothetical protein
MVEGPTAKAYTIKIGQEFKDEIVNDVFVKSSRRIYVLPKDFVGLRF